MDGKNSSRKAILSYCLLILLLLIVAGVGIYSVSALRHANNLIIRHEVTTGFLAQTLRYDIARVRQKEKSLFISIGRRADPARDDDPEQEFAGFNTYVEELLTNVGRLEKMPLSDASSKFVAEIPEETRRYQAAIAAIYQDILSGKIKTPAQADDALIPYKELIRGNREGALAIVGEANQKLNQAILETEESALTLEKAIIALSLLAVLIGTGAAFLTSRHIARTETENAALNARLAQRFKEQTEELDQALATLSHARDDLVRNERLVSLGALVAGVAHELNTPIGVAVLAATTLQDLNAEFKKSVESGLSRSALTRYLESSAEGVDLISRNLARAATRISGFKQLSVDQTSELRRVFDLRAVVAEVVQSLGPILKKTSHCVEIDIPEDLRMDGYPGPLGQIIINLINNALLHGFDGRENGLVRISAHELDANTVALTVSDNGIGMSAEIARKVFDPFFSTKLGQGGSGLGMHIVSSIVTRYFDGSIRLETRPGEGSRWLMALKRTSPALFEHSAQP